MLSAEAIDIAMIDGMSVVWCFSIIQAPLVCFWLHIICSEVMYYDILDTDVCGATYFTWVDFLVLEFIFMFALNLFYTASIAAHEY